MKAMMKATIGRDYSETVVSSCNIETIPLSVAQSMSPRPRPPSPASRARVQKERYAGINPNTLSAKDAALLMNAPGGLASSATSPRLTANDRRKSSANSVRGSPAPVSPRSPTAKSPLAFGEPKSPTADKFPNSENQDRGRVSDVSSTPRTPELTGTANLSAKEQSLLAWVNWKLPSSVPRATSFDDSFRSGKILTRLVEELSGKPSGISDEDFAKFRPTKGNSLYDPDYFDVCFNVFDAFAAAGLSTDDISMDDMLSGNGPKIIELCERIQSTFP